MVDEAHEGTSEWAWVFRGFYGPRLYVPAWQHGLGRSGTNRNIGPPAGRVNVSFLPLAALYEHLNNKTEGCGVPPTQNLQSSTGACSVSILKNGPGKMLTGIILASGQRCTFRKII